MNVQQLKAFLLFVAASIVALCTGYAIAEQQYSLLGLTVAAAVGTALIVMPGYIPFIGFGLLTPFVIPIPFVWGVPPLALVLGLCFVKRFVRVGLTKNDVRPMSSMNLGIKIFFLWVLMRYCLDPIAPNTSGFGDNITGFRPYLNYAICFGFVFSLGQFIKSTEDVRNLFKWLIWLCVGFIVLLVPLMFTRSFAVASMLQYFGLYVTFYDNGLFRFVALPQFGLMLIAISLFPNLVPAKRRTRAVLFVLGLIAVVLGGSRSGLAMATILVVVTPLLRQRIGQSVTVLIAVGVFYLGAYVAGETLSHRDSGVFRVLTLVSPRLAEHTQSTGTWEFREIRWRLALQQIKQRPWVGRSYGGVQNAYVYNDFQGFEESRLEIDLASGGVHNGYIACALAFGIPAALFFIAFLVWSIFFNWKRAINGHSLEARSLHGFVCANLIAYAVTIYIGTDLNSPLIWFFIGLGVLGSRVQPKQVRIEKSEPFRLSARRPAMA